MKDALTSHQTKTKTKMPLFCYQMEKTEVIQFSVPTDYWKESAQSAIDEAGAVLHVWDAGGWDSKEFEDECMGDLHEDLDWEGVIPDETDNGDGTTTLRYEQTFYLTFNLPSELGADWDEEYECRLTNDCRLHIFNDDVPNGYVIEADEHGDAMTLTDYWEDELLDGTTFKRCVCIRQ